MGRAFEYRKNRKFRRWAAMSKAFTKIGKEIAMAVAQAGPNPDSNNRLKIAIKNAKGANMPKANVEAAIKKASGKDQADYSEIVYEGYGPGGIAIVIETATNNINRTVANLRLCFNKLGGSLGTSGSVVFMFQHKGIFTIPAALVKDEDSFTLEMIDAGADDVEGDEESYMVTCPFESFGPVNAKLDELGIEAEESTLTRIPENLVSLDIEKALQVMKLLERIEDDDDVQKVFHNMELTDELHDAMDKE